MNLQITWLNITVLESFIIQTSQEINIVGAYYLPLDSKTIVMKIPHTWII